MDPVCNIESLPYEILIKIFGYLTHNELGSVSRVCRRFNECTRCPLLWQKVNVKFSWYHGFQNEAASLLIQKLPSSVTHVKIDFKAIYFWERGLNFEELCVGLKDKCFHLHTLVLHHALFSVSLPSVMHLCREFFPNLKALILHNSQFYCNCKEREFNGHSKIEILDVSGCVNIRSSSMVYAIFSKMSRLRKLNLAETYVTGEWFGRGDDSSFLHQLEWLHVGNTHFSSGAFHMIQRYAVNLTELFLCSAKLGNVDLRWNPSVMPLLKTICIKYVLNVTCEGVLPLVQSCPSLQNVYVHKKIAESYWKHPFVTSNPSKLKIVKVVDDCDEHEKRILA